MQRKNEAFLLAIGLKLRFKKNCFRRVILPPAPMSSAVHSTAFSANIQKGTSVSLAAGPSSGMVSNRLEELPQDLASSRQSFRIAMSQPFEFFVDNL